MGNKTLWIVLAWLSIICGLVTNLIGWIALLTGNVYWNIPNEFWFYDTIASGLFAVFFLIYSVHSKN